MTGISQYEWTPGGNHIAFLSSGTTSAEEKAKLEQLGIVYDDQYGSANSKERSWFRKQPMEIWIYDVHQRKEEKVWEHPSINRIVWSPDGKKIAIEYRPTDKFLDLGDIGIFLLASGKFIPLVTWQGRNTNPRWSPDGKSIAFLAEDGTEARFPTLSTYSIFIVELNGGEAKKLTSPLGATNFANLWWGKDRPVIITETDDRSQSALYSVSTREADIQKISSGSDHLSGCSFNIDQSVASCVRQNLTNPPEVAVIDLKSGLLKTLTTLNPEYKHIRLGQVSELRWRNKHGYETNGFLIRPLDYIEGKRYPLLVILYSFSGKFISQAQWITSYPAQVFAANGYAVLLMNYPRFDLRRYDSKEGAMSFAYNPLASIEKGVERIVEMRIAEPKRKGIMGWSYGSFLTYFTTSHSDLFEAASSGEGSSYTPSSYWLRGEYARNYLNLIFGGPPLGRYLGNYNEISPAFNAHRIRAPVLMEYRADDVLELQFYQILKYHGVPAEFVLYPDESHVFYQPEHRFYSMQRNLDWFNFWLQGKEDPDPAKQEQYKRWRELLKLQEENHKKELNEKTVKD